MGDGAVRGTRWAGHWVLRVSDESRDPSPGAKRSLYALCVSQRDDKLLYLKKKNQKAFSETSSTGLGDSTPHVPAAPASGEPGCRGQGVAVPPAALWRPTRPRAERGLEGEPAGGAGAREGAGRTRLKAPGSGPSRAARPQGAEETDPWVRPWVTGSRVTQPGTPEPQ